MGAAKLLDWLFPRRCPFCGRVEPSDLPCETCQKTLPWLLGPSARSHVEHIDDVYSALGYRGTVRDAVLTMKFGKRLSRAKPLGVLAAQCARDNLDGAFDLVSWPSLSAKRLRKRGFDQGELLAREVAAALGRKATRLFVKEHRPAQSGMESAAARRANILGAYRLLRPEAVAGKSVLLVDDVITSGATLSECAAVLRLAGAARVCAVTVAKAGQGAQGPLAPGDKV